MFVGDRTMASTSLAGAAAVSKTHFSYNGAKRGALTKQGQPHKRHTDSSPRKQTKRLGPNNKYDFCCINSVRSIRKCDRRIFVE